MASCNAWFPFYAGDYAGDTLHLTTVEHGAYLLLLIHEWRTGPLPDDDARLATVARMLPTEWQQIAPTIRAFFTLRDGRLVQPRLERERNRAGNKVEQRRKAGLASAAARAGKKTGASKPNGEATDVQRPLEQTLGQPQPDPHKKKGGEETQAGDADPPAESDPPRPSPVLVPLPGGRHGMAPETTEIIAAFDAARASAFGKPLARNWPHPQDASTAQRWLNAGAEKGLAPAEVVAIATSVFDASHRARAARQPNDPPGTLGYHDAAIARALTQSTTPLETPTDGFAPRPRSDRPGARPGRCEPFPDQSVGRLAVLDVMAERLEAAGYAAGGREGRG